jgi:hypothetical protein
MQAQRPTSLRTTAASCTGTRHSAHMPRCCCCCCCCCCCFYCRRQAARTACVRGSSKRLLLPMLRAHHARSLHHPHRAAARTPCRTHSAQCAQVIFRHKQHQGASLALGAPAHDSWRRRSRARGASHAPVPACTPRAVVARLRASCCGAAPLPHARYLKRLGLSLSRSR